MTKQEILHRMSKIQVNGEVALRAAEWDKLYAALKVLIDEEKALKGPGCCPWDRGEAGTTAACPACKAGFES